MVTCVLSCGCVMEICQQERKANFHLGSQFLKKWVGGCFKGLNANVAHILRLIRAHLEGIDLYC